MNTYPKIKNRELHRIVATAIIYRDRKYLITQRALTKKAWPGRWTVPGGGLSVDDYLHTTPTTKNDIWYYALEKNVRREVKEETNLTIGPIRYLLDLAFIRPDHIPVLTLSFYAPWKSGAVKLHDQENISYAWITAREVIKYDLIEGISDEIKMVEKLLKNKLHAHSRDQKSN